MACFDQSKLHAAERKLAEMEGAMQVVDQEIGGLEEQQAELLRQLKLIQEQISAAKAKRVRMCGVHAAIVQYTKVLQVDPMLLFSNSVAACMYISSLHAVMDSFGWTHIC